MNSSRTQRLAVVAGGFAVAAGALIAAGAPASATPGSCNYSVGSFSVSLRCTSGTGQYRVVATCTDELRGNSGTYYGAWVSINGASSVTCPYQGGVQWQLTGHSKQTR